MKASINFLMTVKKTYSAEHFVSRIPEMTPLIEMHAVQAPDLRQLRPAFAVIPAYEDAARFAELRFERNEVFAGFSYGADGAVDKAMVQHADLLAGIAGARESFVFHCHVHAAGLFGSKIMALTCSLVRSFQLAPMFGLLKRPMVVPA